MKFKELKVYWVLLAILSVIPWILRSQILDLGVGATMAVGSLDLLITFYLLKKLNFKWKVALPLFVSLFFSQIHFFQYLLMFFAWSVKGFAP